MKNYSVIILVLLLNTGMDAQWVKTDFNDSDVLLSVDFTSADGVLGGWHLPGLVNAYYTTDLGNTWQTASTPDSLRVIVELQMMNDTLIYGCGAKNKIFPISSSTLKYNELFTDRRNYHLFKQGILSAADHEMYRAQFLQSTDRGHSWQYKGSLPDTAAYLVDLQFISMNTGYTLAHNDSSSGLLKTTDGGNTWNWSFLASPDIGLYSFSFLDSLNGFIVGADPAGGLIVKTTDGGLTWSNIVMNGTLEVSKIKCILPAAVVVSTLDLNFGQNIFISSNSGSSWNLVYSHANMLIDGINGLPGGWIIFYGTYFPTGSSTPAVNGTTNMGQTWVESTLSPLINIVLTGSKMIDNNRWYITGSNMLSSGFLLHTSNSGGLPVEFISFAAVQSGNYIKLEWTTATETNNSGFEIERKTPDSEFRTIGFIKGKGTTAEKQSYSFIDQPEYLRNKMTYRLKQVDFNGSFSYSNEVNLDLVTPLEFELKQNYPNPFNPNTTIAYSIPAHTHVQLTVYDALGRKAATLVDEEKPAGNYEITWDAVNLPGGIYFCRIHAGRFMKTKKMLLLK